MRCGGTVGFSLSQAIEKFLKLAHPRNHDSHCQDPKLFQQTEIIQVPVIKLGLVVPFDFQSNLIFEIIYFVSRDRDRSSVNRYLDVERLLLPTPLMEKIIECFGNWRFTLTRSKDVASPQDESPKAVHDVLEFIRVIARKDSRGVPSLVDVILIADCLRNAFESHEGRILSQIPITFGLNFLEGWPSHVKESLLRSSRKGLSSAAQAGGLIANKSTTRWMRARMRLLSGKVEPAHFNAL